MGSRTRSRSIGWPSGSYKVWNGSTWITYNGTVLSDFHETVDVTGNYPNDNPYRSDRRWTEVVGRISGVSPNGYVVIDGCAYPSQPNPTHLSLPSFQPDAYYVTKAAAEHNPSRPLVALPVTIAEIRNLPGRIFDAGMKYMKTGRYPFKRAKSSDNSVVGYNFGWAPLISDVGKLLDFEAHCRKRNDELVQRTTGTGHRRTMGTMEFKKTTSSQNLTIWSIGGTVTARRDTFTSKRVWVSTRWKPDYNLDGSIPTMPELQSRARAAMQGWPPSLADAWELFPWSWLADYFVNVGDFLQATRNTVGLRLVSSCLMEETETGVTDFVTSRPAWLTVTPMRRSLLWKRRRLVSPSVATLTNPLIGPGQLMNLLSIAHNYNSGG